jgi:hypothetical protein
MSVDTTNWKRTSRGKLICPSCGATGWSYQTRYVKGWLDAHAEHVTHPCGRTTTARGAKRHVAHCSTCPAGES